MNHRSNHRKLPHVIPDDDDDNVPFDEASTKHKRQTQHRPLYLQTKACLRALAGTSRVQPHFQEQGTPVASVSVPPPPPLPLPSCKRMAMANATAKQMASKGKLMETPVYAARPLQPPPALRTPPQAHNHDGDFSTPNDCFPCGAEDVTCGASSVEDIAILTCRAMEDLGGCAPPPPPLQLSQMTLSRSSSSSHSYQFAATRIGPPQCCVFKTQLPDALLPLLEPIMARAESHANARRHGWETNLYSLTKQDLPLAEIPGGMSLAQPLTDFVVWSLQQLYAGSRCQRPPVVRMDTNQPHVLKYDVSHSGVPLHHDKCDVTAQLLLSHSNEYQGGGTYFCDLDATVRLERGELLFHPGSLVHAGREITNGSRLLLVWFLHLR
ncbi:hypothetical protein MPSEU_000871900 [Mayamaea pseudoterrestris]|nr:hypothetical protein MPSEU_000871900 [Mayamaea pseudoterrestris]